VVDALDGVFLTAHGARVDIRTARARYDGVRPLPGEHQRLNLVVALRLLEEAQAAGVPVDLSAVPARISKTHWPGRLQELAGPPRVLLDGAHNPAAALALARYLGPLPPFVLLFGAMADKDVEAVGRTLFPLAAHVIVTRPAGSRAAAPEEIVTRVGEVPSRVEAVATVPEALARARERATPGGLVVVAGSLYLVGEVLRLMGEEP
jgi:dihydrofolate synthase / folylpolyglutamate synthase